MFPSTNRKNKLKQSFKNRFKYRLLAPKANKAVANQQPGAVSSRARVPVFFNVINKDIKGNKSGKYVADICCGSLHATRGGGLGSRPKKMYGERLGDGVEYHLMSPTPRR